MASYFEIIEAAATMSNSELAKHFNPDALFSEANGGAAARSHGHNMKVRAERMIAEGRGEDQYVPIRQRNGSGGIVTNAKPTGKGKTVTALTIENAQLRGLIIQAVSVAGYTYNGTMNTERDCIRGHIENKTPALINAIRALSPLMGLDDDKAINDLSEWAGVKTLAQRKVDNALNLFGQIKGLVSLARENEKRRLTLLGDGFQVYPPIRHYSALQIDDAKLAELKAAAEAGDDAWMAGRLSDLVKPDVGFVCCESGMDNQAESVIKTMIERDLMPLAA